MKKIALLPLTLLLLLLACGSKRTVSEKSNFPQQVATEQAQMRKLQKEHTLAGRVTTNPETTTDYSPLVSGVIVRSYFLLGELVSRGQTMVDIRSAELSGLQSELTIAKRNLASVEALHQSGMATERELVEARSTLSKAQADLSLYGDNKGEGIFSIKAPTGGYVTHKHCNAGSTVSAGGDSLFTIADLSTVCVEANVYATSLQFVHEGDRVEVTTLAYPDKIFSGKIGFLSPLFDSEEKALKARITLSNNDLKLKPEMPVTIRLLFEASREMVAVRSDAIIFDNDGYFVVVSRAGNYEIRPITLHDHHGGFTYISHGIEAGEEVVVKNQLLIFSELNRV